MSVRGDRIEHQALPAQSTLQWPDKAVLEIPDEPLNLAFGLRAIRRAHTRAKPVMLGKLPKTRMEPVLAWAIGITVNHDRLHVIKQNGLGHTTNRVEETLMAIDECVELLILGEPNKTISAKSERRDKGR